LFNYSSFLPPGTQPLTLEEYDTPDNPYLYDLPHNYRAPSPMGISIPRTSNVYNVHPEQDDQSYSLSALVTPKK